MKKKLFYILLPLILASIESIFLNFNDFNIINKPPFSPPQWIFPVVWTILYLIMGYTYNNVRENLSKKGKLFYYIQLILNLSWSIIFFNFKNYLLSIIIIILLIIFVVNMIIEFTKVNEKAGYLNIPYLIWLQIAYYLAIGIYLLN